MVTLNSKLKKLTLELSLETQTSIWFHFGLGKNPKQINQKKALNQ